MSCVRIGARIGVRIGVRIDVRIGVRIDVRIGARADEACLFAQSKKIPIAPLKFACVPSNREQSPSLKTSIVGPTHRDGSSYSMDGNKMSNYYYFADITSGIFPNEDMTSFDSLNKYV